MKYKTELQTEIFINLNILCNAIDLKSIIKRKIEPIQTILK